MSFIIEYLGTMKCQITVCEYKRYKSPSIKKRTGKNWIYQENAAMTEQSRSGQSLAVREPLWSALAALRIEGTKEPS